MSKRAIPAVPRMENTQAQQFLGVVKEQLETINGSRRGKLANLSAQATTADIIDRVNELLRRMQE